MSWSFRPHRACYASISCWYAIHSTLLFDDLLDNHIPGFMTKIKKILETVCHNCGKILVDEVSHPSRDGRSSFAIIADTCDLKA